MEARGQMGEGEGGGKLSDWRGREGIDVSSRVVCGCVGGMGGWVGGCGGLGRLGGVVCVRGGVL